MKPHMRARRTARRTILAMACASLLLAACSQRARIDDPGGAPQDQMRAALDEGARSNAAAPPPKDVVDALLPPVAPRLPGASAEPRFDLAVDEAPAAAFFKALVDGTPYNMLVHPEVSGTISLKLKDVTVPGVMQMVRRVYGYEYELRDSGYIVLPARLESRIFHFDYLNVNRTGESNIRVNAGQVSEGERNAGAGDSVAIDRDTESSQRGASARIRTASAADFWGRLEQTLRSLIGNDQGRSVVVDADAGLVVVRAMPGELRDVENYLAQAQGNLSRQVILEAKILEVDLSDDFQAGINWAVLFGGGNGDSAFAVSTAIGSGVPGISTDGSSLSLPSITGGVAAQALDFGGLFAIGARTSDFAALIRLLDTQGDVHVLSSPRISTLNNQKAVIKVGTDEFFVTDISTDQNLGSVAATNSVDIELTPFFSGIALDVTPQISREGGVTLHVHPSVSEVVDQTKNLTIANEEQSLPLAFSSVRESDSIVHAEDGQVIVIGGLMQNQTTRRRAQPGGLGDLPVIGELFRQRGDSARRSELVILLRPIVARTRADWANSINEVSRRMPSRPPPPEHGSAR